MLFCRLRWIRKRGADSFVPTTGIYEIFGWYFWGHCTICISIDITVLNGTIIYNLLWLLGPDSWWFYCKCAPCCSNSNGIVDRVLDMNIEDATCWHVRRPQMVKYRFTTPRRRPFPLLLPPADRAGRTPSTGRHWPSYYRRSTRRYVRYRPRWVSLPAISPFVGNLAPKWPSCSRPPIMGLHRSSLPSLPPLCSSSHDGLITDGADHTRRWNCSRRPSNCFSPVSFRGQVWLTSDPISDAVIVTAVVILIDWDHTGSDWPPIAVRTRLNLNRNVAGQGRRWRQP